MLKDDDEKRFFVASANWVTRSLGLPLPSFLRESIRFELARTWASVPRVESTQIFVVTGRVGYESLTVESFPLCAGDV